MNWRRGLFRLWLIATVAWLLVVGGLLLPNDIALVFKLRHIDSSYSCEDHDPCDLIEANLAKRRALAEKRLMRNTPRILAPPAVLFILGVIGFWIAAGFRKR